MCNLIKSLACQGAGTKWPLLIYCAVNPQHNGLIEGKLFCWSRKSAVQGTISLIQGPRKNSIQYLHYSWKDLNKTLCLYTSVSVNHIRYYIRTTSWNLKLRETAMGYEMPVSHQHSVTEYIIIIQSMQWSNWHPLSVALAGEHHFTSQGYRSQMSVSFLYTKYHWHRLMCESMELHFESVHLWIFWSYSGVSDWDCLPWYETISSLNSLYPKICPRRPICQHVLAITH